MKDCKNSCVVLITIKSLLNKWSDKLNDDKEETMFRGEFTLIVSSDIVKIIEGKQITDNVEAKSYKYYSIDINVD